ncbi:hypothetical protein ACFLRY_01270 [Bacteroidota bacterium]
MHFDRLFYLIPTYLQLYNDVKRQRSFINTHLSPEIEIARKNNDGTLDEDDFKKITSYYGFGVPAIVGEMFCTLHGKKMSEKERICNTYQGALTGLFDDFFDKTGIGNKQILSMADDPCSYPGKSSLENLFTSFLCKVYQNIPDLEKFKSIAYKVLDDQNISLKQKDSLFKNEDLLALTIAKGGHSLLFYRSAFNFPFADGEKEAIYEIGGLMQFGNDIFDVYEDSRENIDTLITVNQDINIVKEAFQNQYNKAIEMAEKMNYPEKNKNLFIRKLIMGISRCYVCLDQLYHLQKKNEMKFDAMKFCRDDLICDMEKPSNVLSFLKYYLIK